MKQARILSLTLTLTLALLLCLSIAPARAADNYPSKQITYMVTFDPGGQSDRDARRQQPILAKLLGQQIVIDYKVGGGGALGWKELSRSKPDGYTIAGFNIPHAILQPMQQNVGYKTEQLIPVCVFESTPLGLAVPAESPYKTLNDLLEAAKKDPGKITIGGSSVFSGQHLSCLRLEKLSGANSKKRNACIVTIARVTDHVAIASLHFEDNRWLLHSLDVLKRITQLGGPLEVERFRREIHSLPYSFHHFLRLSVEEEKNLLDHRPIVLLALRENAGGLAALDEVVEARTLGHLARHVVIARAHREDPLHNIQRAPHRADVGIRPEIPRAVVLKLAGHVDARERLLNSDLYVRIRLVIAKSDVEARPVFLDEIRFEDQGVRLRRDDDRFEVPYLIDEVACLRAFVMVLREIAAHA
jgi:hypothetical protein